MNPASFQSGDRYDCVVAGTGFASSFFLHEFLKRQPASYRVLVAEAGSLIPHEQQTRTRQWLHVRNEGHFTNENPEKPWYFTRHWGGGSNCWFASTPRMLPADFKVKSLFGVGADWPLAYDDLEPYYVEAERLLQVSGDGTNMPYPMSAPYPQPPHRFSEPDQILRDAHPDTFFHLPTARARLPVPGSRAACCGNSVCHICPVNAKFTIENGMAALYEDPRVEVALNCPVSHLETRGSTVSAAVLKRDGRETRVEADLFVLGANGLFNPFIMLKSGMSHGGLGTGICEQVGVSVFAEFTRTQNFLGSTITTGLGFGGMLHTDRSQRAGFLFHTANRARGIQLKKGRWFNTAEFIIVIEDLRQPENRVVFDPADPDRPRVRYRRHSDYAERTAADMPRLLEPWLQPLDIERLEVTGRRDSESHIQCTTPMGESAEDSVVDRDCVSHRHRNLVVLGSGNFPTASPANPTLTLCALSLRSASRLSA
jgi:choline dehydrogenase-like flavoprotein